MSSVNRITALILCCLVLAAADAAFAQDWPQWRGPNRDARVTGFNPPATWPKELKQQWKVAVGDGVATPALVGGKLYVFARQAGNEVLRCLDAATGKELWQSKYEAAGVRGPASRFSGPRSSPTVADGKVVTLGVQGTLCCFDAATGKQLWRKSDFEGSVPRFATSSSPIVVDGLCVAQVGADRDGAIVAYDLATGSQKWKWTGDGPAYGSPVLMTVGGTKVIVAPASRNMVALRAADGKELWRIPYSQGRYNSATPIVDGETIIYAGPRRGTTAMKLTKQGDTLTAEQLWSNPDNSVGFNTPVLKGDLLFGISSLNSVFCVNVKTGQTAWTAPLGTSEGGPAGRGAGAGRGGRGARDGQRGRGGRGGRRGGRGGGGYGSVVDTGSVLLALTPSAQMIVFTSTGGKFEQLASYKVADGGTYAYPVVSGNRVFIKDQDAVTLWTIE